MCKFVGFVASILFLAGCTEKNEIIKSSSEKVQLHRETVQLQGTLQSWACGSRNGWGEPAIPFTIRTGEHPHITVIYPDNSSESFTTDDSSRFTLNIAPGNCKVAVTTRYTFPADTFQFDILSDSTSDLDILMGVLEADTMIFSFLYATMADTLSIAREWAAITLLNAQVGDAFGANSANPPIECHHYLDLFPGFIPMYSLWYIPLRDTTYNIMEVGELAQKAVLADTGSYHHMYVDPKGVYGCEL